MTILKKKSPIAIFGLIAFISTIATSLSAGQQNCSLTYLPENCYNIENSCCNAQPFRGSLSVRGEFLYWQPVITGMSYALTRTTATVPFGPFGPGTVPDNVIFQNISFDYSPGYRIGGRYELCESQWDLDVEYTSFQKTANESIQPGVGVTIDTLWDALSAVNPSQASANLNVNLKQVNACIGKTLPFCGCFSLRPDFGFQWYKIDSIENIQYVGITTVSNVPLASTANIQLLNKTSAWGLLGGLNALWQLPYNFGLFGNAHYGLARTEHSVSQNQQTIVLTQDEVDLTSTTNFSSIAQNFNLKAGLNWNRQLSFFNHCWDIDLFVAYEMSVWLQNIQISRVLSLGTGFSDANTTNIGNVGFRGLTAGFGIGF